jgi:alanyl-tRNA synthetase
VTGEDAHEAQRIADAFAEQLTQLGKMGHGAEKEKAQKLLQLELDKLAISAVRKSQFRKTMEKISREILDGQKKQQKEDTKKAIEAVTASFSKDPKKVFAVVTLQSAGNPKLVPDVLKHVQTKMKDKSVYVLVKESDKVAHGCIVSPEAAKAGVSSSDWAKSVSDVVKGKAGGKPPLAIGNGTETGKVDEAVEKATEYLAGFKL